MGKVRRNRQKINGLAHKQDSQLEETRNLVNVANMGLYRHRAEGFGGERATTPRLGEGECLQLCAISQAASVTWRTRDRMLLLRGAGRERGRRGGIATPEALDGDALKSEASW